MQPPLQHRAKNTLMQHKLDYTFRSHHGGSDSFLDSSLLCHCYHISLLSLSTAGVLKRFPDWTYRESPLSLTDITEAQYLPLLRPSCSSCPFPSSAATTTSFTLMSLITVCISLDSLYAPFSHSGASALVEHCQRNLDDTTKTREEPLSFFSHSFFFFHSRQGGIKQA